MPPSPPAVEKAEALGGADQRRCCRRLRQPRRFPAHARRLPQSIAIAIDKAYTAGGFGFPTGKWMDVCAGNGA